jgi:hypothetical protein
LFIFSTKNVSGSKLPPIHSFHVPVLRVLGVADRFEEVGVAPSNATIVGRARPGPIHTPGVLCFGLELQRLLPPDLVLPGVTEVELVDQPGLLLAREDLA